MKEEWVMPKTRLIVPPEYRPALNIRQTEVAIKQVKDYFERKLAETLQLTRVSAPLMVWPESGLNDNLNGVERPVQFDIGLMPGRYAEVVQSLAKWKRMALKRYAFSLGEGLYTDMNAIRRDDDMDNLHSVYVDQWDWEVIIGKEHRSLAHLETLVGHIFDVFKCTEAFICAQYPQLKACLPEQIYCVTSSTLEKRWPELTPREREARICREKKAVFISQIGGNLSNGKPHDHRAPDYDDWNLNGDILFYYDLLDRPIEMSSMGIRVDPESLMRQLQLSHCMSRAALPFQKSLLQGQLPLTAGGGIGQSRMCMFMLGKAHIGEVQASIWPEQMISACHEAGIDLL